MGAQQGCPEAFPVKTPKKPRRTEKYTVFVFSCSGQYAVQKRPNHGLLAGLWQFPNLPGELTPERALTQAKAFGLSPRELVLELHRDHIFTHVQWDMTCYVIAVQSTQGNFLWQTREEIDQKIPLPTAFRQFWEELKHTDLL